MELSVQIDSYCRVIQLHWLSNYCSSNKSSKTETDRLVQTSDGSPVLPTRTVQATKTNKRKSNAGTLIRTPQNKTQKISPRVTRSLAKQRKSMVWYHTVTEESRSFMGYLYRELGWALNINVSIFATVIVQLAVKRNTVHYMYFVVGIFCQFVSSDVPVSDSLST